MKRNLAGVISKWFLSRKIHGWGYPLTNCVSENLFSPHIDTGTHTDICICPQWFNEVQESRITVQYFQTSGNIAVLWGSQQRIWQLCFWCLLFPFQVTWSLTSVFFALWFSKNISLYIRIQIFHWRQQLGLCHFTCSFLQWWALPNRSFRCP